MTVVSINHESVPAFVGHGQRQLQHDAGVERSLATRAFAEEDPPLPWDHFCLSVAEEDGRPVVRLQGGLDFVFVDEVRAAFSSLAHTDAEVDVDLCRLTFIDSTGLSALMSARRAVMAAGGTCRLRGARGLVRRVFEATEMADILDD